LTAVTAKAAPKVVPGVLRAVRRLSAETFWLDIETPAADLFRAPASFVKLRGWPEPETGAGPLLDRPFSIHRVQAGGVQVLLRRVGPATRLLSELAPGAPLKLTGPLGRSLAEAAPEADFYLAAGGIGLAPMALVLDWLAARGRHGALFYGERSGAGQVPRDWLAAWAGDCTATVDDGSGYGRPGLVTEARAEALARAPRPVFACGPAPMLAAVSLLARNFGVTPLVSVEARMACGLGVCLGCSLPLKAGGRFLVCREGPVADGRTLDWEAA
jgi:dihydroorotate dehydrogenase electron transfer subunit